VQIHCGDEDVPALLADLAPQSLSDRAAWYGDHEFPSNEWNVGKESNEGFRLRPRAKNTSQAWAMMLGLLRDDDGFLCTAVDGSPVHNLTLFVQEAFGQAAKLLGLQRVTTGNDDTDFILRIRSGSREGIWMVSVRLFAELRNWVLFKERTTDILSSLVSRARQRARDIEYPAVTLMLVLPDTVALAFMVSDRERRAWDRMSLWRGVMTVDYSARFAAGHLHPGRWYAIKAFVHRQWSKLPGPNPLTLRTK
jgi:hypothetical protein